MTLRGKSNALFSLGLCLLSLGLASKASAIPAFARKYGMACTACHEAWPKLNAQGWAFRDNGYQWLAGKDSPIDLRPEYWPVSLRDTIGYQYQSTTNVPQNAGVNSAGTPIVQGTTVQRGQIGLTNIDLLFAGTLTKDISFLITIEPFLTNSGFNPEYPSAASVIAGPGQPGFVESAWVRFDNIVGSPYLNFKIGKGALDVPYDEHRSFFIFNNSYAMYHYQPPGSGDLFGLGNNQWQASLEGHNEGSSTRYALSLVETQNSPGTNNVISSAGGYFHVQQLMFPQAKGVAEIRGGLFGSLTSFPTQARYYDTTCATSPATCNTAPSGPVVPGAPIIPYTGYKAAMAYRAGAEISTWFGMLATPLNLRLAGVYGNEDKLNFAPVTDAAGNVIGQNWEWMAWLAELDWTPILNFTAAFNWNGVQNIQTNDPTVIGGAKTAGQQENETLALRYQFQIFPRTGQTLHFEFGHSVVWGTGANGANQETWNAFGGLDFAF
jgi:hypothetical protein